MGGPRIGRWKTGDGGQRWGRPPPGWWQARNGRWYPPSFANHPAARAELSALRESPPVAPVRPFPAWSLLAGPVVVATLALAGLVRMTGGTSGLRTDDPTVTTDGPATVESPDWSAPPPTAGPPTARPPTAPSTTTASTTGVSPPPLAPPMLPDGTVPAAATTVPSRRSAPSSSVPPVSSTAPAAPAMPSTADDCRDGGWAELVDDQGRPFAHQGECVAWVNRRSSRS